jgi:hypothetical protein
MKLKTVIAALALAAIGLFAGAPYYTAHQIRQAVQNGDAAALARHVDFERVRASLKRQLADGVARQLPDSARTGFMADLGAMLAGRAADVALQALITPEGVTDLLGGRMGNPFDKSPPEAGAEGAGNPPAAPAESRRISARYVGWDRFQVDLPAKGRTVNLMLSREGLLNWKLTGIDLSDLL